MKRVKVRISKPNPLFEYWLEEWMNEAAARNSDLRHHFSKALKSLKKYPLPLKSGKDCIILQHFGTKLCSMLDKKLEEHKAKNDGVVGVSNDYVCISCKNNEKDHVSKRKCNNQRGSSERQCAQKRTELSVFDTLCISSWSLENYAALLILYNKSLDPCYAGYVSEVDVLFQIKELCGNASKASISNLFDNGLVSMTGSPIRYSLTEYGAVIVKKICEVTTVDLKLVTSLGALSKIQSQIHLLHAQNLMPGKNVGNDTSTVTSSYKSLQFPETVSEEPPTTITLNHEPEKLNVSPAKNKSNKSNNDKKRLPEVSKELKNPKNNTVNKVSTVGNGDTSNKNQKNIYLQSKEFNVILLVDKHEICGGKTKPQYDATIVELTKLDVPFEVRHLNVGDFAWVARCKFTKAELVLPYIVERKRIDDLSSSITDGRFHEQKFRLKQSGIENLMYIVEEYDKNCRTAIPHSSLMQAAINSIVQDGFVLKYTKSHKDSMFYLSSLTRILNKIYMDKNLLGCKKDSLVQTNLLSTSTGLMEFEEFNKAASKQKVFKVSQMFVRQLIQLKGMSVDKALAIVERYSTPRILIDAFQKSDSNAELLLANIQFGDQKRLLGPVISKTIHQLYTRRTLN